MDRHKNATGNVASLIGVKQARTLDHEAFDRANLARSDFSGVELSA